MINNDTDTETTWCSDGGMCWRRFFKQFWLKFTQTFSEIDLIVVLIFQWRKYIDFKDIEA